MPVVPTLTAPTVTPTPGPGGGFNAAVDNPDAAAAPGKQMQQLGNATEQLGTTVQNINTDQQNEANTVRVNDALNQARQKAQDLTFNPTTGYKVLKGLDALQRPDGQALPDEYGAKLQDSISQISASLGNDEQRRQFALQAGAVATGFHGDLEQHMLGEFTNYHTSVQDGTIKLAEEQAGNNWNNPDKIDQAINGIADPNNPDNPRVGGLKQAIYAKAKLTGMSATESQAAMDEAVSAVHANVIENALENTNPTYASNYYNQHRSEMTPQDTLKVQGLINHQMDSYTANTAASQTAQELSSQIAPTDFDRLANVVSNTESRGQDLNPDGSVVTSGKGAKGKMQVLDSTNSDPGYGVTPAKDNSLAERARVGRDYLGAMVKHYPTLDQALAAYNAGPGKVDEAVKEAKAENNPSGWLQKLPAETQNYVSTNLSKFNAGGGVAPLPTEYQFVQSAIAKAGPNPRMEVVTATTEQAKQQYAQLIAARKQQGDQALAAAQQELINNGGNFNALSPGTISALSAVDPKNYADAKKFASSVQDQPTNPAAFTEAVSHPENLTAMNDTQFTQYATTNFSPADREKITQLRADTMSGKNNDSAVSLNNEAINTALNSRLNSVGISVKDKNNAQQVGSAQIFFRNDILQQQKQMGRKMNEAEIEARIDKVFNSSVTAPGTLWGTNTTQVPSLKIGDVPSSVQDAIKASLAKRKGISNPSDDLILRTYQNGLVNNNGSKISG